MFFGLAAIFALLGRIFELNWLSVLSIIVLIAAYVSFVVGVSRKAFNAQNGKNRKKIILLWIALALVAVLTIFSVAPAETSRDIAKPFLSIMMATIAVMYLINKDEEKTEQ